MIRQHIVFLTGLKPKPVIWVIMIMLLLQPLCGGTTWPHRFKHFSLNTVLK